MAIAELAIVKCLGRDGDAMFLAPCVGKTKVDELDLVLLDRFHDVGAACHSVLLVRVSEGMKTNGSARSAETVPAHPVGNALCHNDLHHRIELACTSEV